MWDPTHKAIQAGCEKQALREVLINCFTQGGCRKSCCACVRIDQFENASSICYVVGGLLCFLWFAVLLFSLPNTPLSASRNLIVRHLLPCLQNELQLAGKSKCSFSFPTLWIYLSDLYYLSPSNRTVKAKQNWIFQKPVCLAFIVTFFQTSSSLVIRHFSFRNNKQERDSLMKIHKLVLKSLSVFPNKKFIPLLPVAAFLWCTGAI